MPIPRDKLGKRQLEILEMIEQRAIQRRPPPTIREIGEKVGLSSSSTVHSHLVKLKNSGFITMHDNKPRALELTRRPEEIEPRPVVRVFSEVMELQLQANDHKPGWEHEEPINLLTRAHHELDELAAAIENLSCSEEDESPLTHDEYVANIVTEAADVANFCMMVADIFGMLRIHAARQEHQQRVNKLKPIGELLKQELFGSTRAADGGMSGGVGCAGRERGDKHE